MSILHFIVLSLVLVLTTTWWFLRSQKSRTRLPPGPFNWPVLGCLHILRRDLPHIALKKLSGRYGDFMYMKLGTVPFVIGSSSEVARETLQVHGLEFASKWQQVAWKHYNTYGFSTYTPGVRLYRKIINTHLLSPSKLKLYEKARSHEHVELARSVYKKAGSPVQLRGEIHAMNMNIISNMLFGERYFGSKLVAQSIDDQELIHFVASSLRLTGAFNISDYIPEISWLDVQGLETRFKKVISGTNKHLFSILQDRKSRRDDSVAALPDGSTGNDAGNDPPPCFIDILMSLEGDEKLSDTQIVNILHDMLLGAVDTSALALEWALTELIRHPSMLQKAQKEIEEVVGNERLVRESDLSELHYLEAISKETLRLHPVAPLSPPRVLEAPCVIKGYYLPAGTVAIVNYYAIGCDEGKWQTPHEFMPERFLESTIDMFGQDCNFLPFGTGRRMCPGGRLGFQNLRMGLATLVQGFDWLLPQGQEPCEIDMREAPGLVISKAEPLVAIAKPRLPAHVP